MASQIKRTSCTARKADSRRRPQNRKCIFEPLEDRRLLAADVLFADSFEVGTWNGNWVEDSQNDWFRSTQRATNGSRSAEVDGWASNATLTLSNPIDLSGYSSAELTFDWLIERGFDSGEYLALDISSDGGATWNTGVRQLTGNSDSENLWSSESVDLTPCASSDVLIRFRANVSRSNEDANVDNVKITGTPSGSEVGIGDAQLIEGNSGTQSLEFTVTRGGDTSGTASVGFATADGTAIAGSDYAATSGTLVFEPGVTSLTIVVPTHDDTIPEPTETLEVTLLDAVGATFTDAQGLGTIQDDGDQAKPVKLFLLAGQSNMNGTAEAQNLDPAWNILQEDVWIWLDHNMDGGQWTTLGPGHGWSTHGPFPDESEGLTPRDGELLVGPELGLGKALADAYPDHRVAFVKHAAGGRSLVSDFNPENIGPPESNEHMWSGLLKKTDDATAAFDAMGFTYEVAGFFWAQGGRDAKNWNFDSTDPAEVEAGEQEALQRSAAYGENLTNFIDAVRNEFVVDLPFVLSHIKEDVSPELLEVYPGVELVRQGQLDVAEALSWTEQFSTANITLRDAVHFDAMGQIEFGTRFANTYLDLVSTSSLPPVADDDAYSVAEDSVLDIAAPGVLDGDTDPESDPLTATLVSNASHGAVALNADGSFSYTPNAEYHGPDSFTYRANDGTSDSNLATVNLTATPVNDAPTADSQTVSVKENIGKSITLSASDIEGSSLTYSVDSSPNSGTLSGTAPNLIYTPDTGFTGADSFTFLASDGELGSNVATVTINVAENLAPVADAQAVSVAEDGSAAITLTGSDADGDPITYSLVALPAGGVLTGTKPNLTYTPSADFNGSDSFTFKVNDGTTDSDVVAVSITVAPVNDNPVGGNDNYSLDQETTLSVAAPGVLANDSDADGDSLSSVLGTGPSNGSLSLNLGTDGSFTYTPNPGFIGSDSFTYGAKDPSGTLSSPVTVSLTVSAVAIGPNLSHGSLESVGSSWETVTLAKSYTSMVVTATPRYNTGSGPGVVRIDNVTSNSFDVRVDNVGSTAFSGGVHYVAVEEGVYDEAGYKFEARKTSSAQTSRKGGWLIDTVSYQQSYSSPVVVGQVMTANDSDWSVFWASSGGRTSPPSASELNIGKHVAEDPDTTRADETIGYLVIEATQNGVIEGLPFVAGVGSDSVRGVDNGTYQYSYTAMPNAKTAILSSAGMDGGDGGWAALYGSDPVPASDGTIDLVIDEDQLGDSERKHTTEQVAYFVIDPPLPEAEKIPAAADGEAALFFVAPNLMSARRPVESADDTLNTPTKPVVPQEPKYLQTAPPDRAAAPGMASERASARLRALDEYFSDHRDLEVEEDLLDQLL